MGGGGVGADLSSTGGTCSIGSGKAVALQSRGEDVVHLKFQTNYFETYGMDHSDFGYG